MFKSKKNLLGEYRFDTKLSTEKLSRRNIVFLHIPKTGGSSFWHAFSAELNSKPELNYAVADAHHDAITLLGSDSKALQALNNIKNNVLNSNLSRIIVHYHMPHGNVGNVLSNVTFLVITRKPLDRLRSAFRHWRGKNPLLDMNTFFSDTVSMGVNHYLAGCLPYHVNPLNSPPAFLVEFIKKNVYFISMEDYIVNSNVIKLIEKSLCISEIKNIHYDGTMTDADHNEELDDVIANNDIFSANWQSYLDAEVMWHKVFNLDV